MFLCITLYYSYFRGFIAVDAPTEIFIYSCFSFLILSTNLAILEVASFSSSRE